jgi:hypothetical protein
MKNLILILLTIALSSCGPESRMYPRQYSLKNESNENIKLKFYFKYNNQLVYGEVITLNNTEIFNGGILETDQPHSNDVNYPINAFKSSDSLIVIYNNQKKSTFSIDFNGNLSTPIDRNPFRHGNYTDIGNDTFQFIFTEDDYNNAIDCVGNCD